MFSISRNQIIALHCAKNDAKLSDAEYRNILKQYAGVDTCKKIASYAAYQAVFSALSKKIIKPQKIEIKKIEVEEKDPWTWIEATPEMWSNSIKIMKSYGKKNIVCVAVWDADNRKRFKIRPMKKWELHQS